ncbi:hypothetical protein L6164_007662 [Bauhinia variegata]|uniref:Uncharacterized protein n=1 Tax=Bauhinia variegata TaxID=167791 RepID=A0ACB9PEL1_BAUVA|nr:hypothetical protein L6164_007662 [Bauhinia variegata]
MKSKNTRPVNGKCSSADIPWVLVLPFTLFLIIYLIAIFISSQYPSSPVIHATSLRSRNIKKCDIFSGEWISDKKAHYYSGETCHLMLDQANCIKNGRPDREFMNWRWKPDECELPLFDAMEFLKIVKGKSMAFVGDSVGRNQMESLLCLLASVASPEDISHRYTSLNRNTRHWFFQDYNFTLATFFSPFLVRNIETDPNGFSFKSTINLYLDEADKEWTAHIESFDFVIISAAQWFFRKLVFYENGQVVGCFNCQKQNITELPNLYGLRKVIRTALRTLNDLKGYNGVTFFRTFSPTHFENGEFNTGGRCARTKPFAKEEMRLEGYFLEAYLTQAEEFRAAEKVARKRGLQFWLLETTEAILLRPDGHPDIYGRMKDKNVSVVDCVHWCLPGPIDTWNEFLLYFLKLGNQTSSA